MNTYMINSKLIKLNYYPVIVNLNQYTILILILFKTFKVLVILRYNNNNNTINTHRQ